MAFSTKRVYYTQDAQDLLPTGHSEQTARASIGTVDIGKQNVVINDISCSGVANATKTTAIAALTTAIIAKIDTLVGTTMGVDTVGGTVSYNFEVYELTRGLAANDILFIEASDVYVVKGRLEVSIT